MVRTQARQLRDYAQQMEEQARLHQEVSKHRLALIEEKNDLLMQLATKFKRERKHMNRLKEKNGLQIGKSNMLHQGNLDEEEESKEKPNRSRKKE